MLIKELDGINKRTAGLLDKYGYRTTNDLALLTPRKYTDYREIKKIQDCMPETCCAVTGKLTAVEIRYSGNNREYIVLKVMQPDNVKFTIVDFSSTYLYEHYLHMKSLDIVACGKVSVSPDYGYSMVNIDGIYLKSTFLPRIKTSYKKFSGISDEMLQKVIGMSLQTIEEVLPNEIVTQEGIVNYKKALYKVHYPETESDIIEGKNRLLYNDLFYFALSHIDAEKDQAEAGIVFDQYDEVVEFMDSLPFPLTSDQFNAIEHFAKNADSGKANNLLLQGDVGCGKTIVAFCCMLAAVTNGYQTLLIAPRTVLARQHYNEISQYAETLGKKCVFLHSGLKTAGRREILECIRNGEADFIIGTHSCGSEDVEYQKLALVVTDEEHLFGVEQKEGVKKKALPGYHAMSMSATPIPRSIAEILYGETKEIITIKEKPANRIPIITGIVRNRAKLYAFMRQELDKGNQCYVVCPAIEDNENGLVNIDRIEQEYKKYFAPEQISVINGKLNKTRMTEEMAKFETGQTNILISTTVIEVGVNVPSATVMVIEQAERFGLATLHQLRGRVGRSERQSYCCLVTNEAINDRLDTLCKTNDGFAIAEADLAQRGAGSLISTEQSGMNKLMEEMTANLELYQHIKELAKTGLRKKYDFSEIYQLYGKREYPEVSMP